MQPEMQPDVQQEPQFVDELTKSKLDELNKLFGEISNTSSSISWMEFDLKNEKDKLLKQQQKVVEYKFNLEKEVQSKYGNVTIQPNGMITPNGMM